MQLQVKASCLQRHRLTMKMFIELCVVVPYDFIFLHLFIYGLIYVLFNI